MEKQTTDIQLFEIYKIYDDLNGSTNQQTNEVLIKGILNEKIKITAKYWLDDLNDEVIKPEKSKLDKIREELIMKYGTFSNGNYSVPQVINKDGVDVMNEKFIAFINEYNEILNQTKTIEFYPIKLSDLADLESEHNYKMIYKFIQK